MNYNQINYNIEKNNEIEKNNNINDNNKNNVNNINNKILKTFTHISEDSNNRQKKKK